MSCFNKCPSKSWNQVSLKHYGMKGREELTKFNFKTSFSSLLSIVFIGFPCKIQYFLACMKLSMKFDALAFRGRWL